MSPVAPLPETDWELTRPFWQAAARSELVIPRCRACRRFVWYPAEHCPHCAEGDPVWTRVSGRGRLFSWAVVERPLYSPFADQVPYVTGLVSLEEDPAVRLVTRIEGCAARDLYVDMPMRARFRPLVFAGCRSEITAPVFEPVGD